MQGTVEGRSDLAVREHLLACLEVHLDEGVRNLVESRLLEPLEEADGFECMGHGVARIHRVGDRDLAVHLEEGGDARSSEVIRGHPRSSEVMRGDAR